MSTCSCSCWRLARPCVWADQSAAASSATALLVLGGLLKFYPLVLLVLMLRERLAVLVALGLGTVAIVLGSAVVYYDELRLLTAPPGGAPFHNRWGAPNFIIGFPTVLQEFLNAIGLPAPLAETLSKPQYVMVIVTAALLSAMLVTALRLAWRDELRAGLSLISDRAYRFLLVGVVLVVGCFFAGQNIGYRGVFLVLILPGLLALTHVSACRALRPVFIMAIASTMCAPVGTGRSVT